MSRDLAGAQLQRARILLEQSRYDLAEGEVRRYLGEYPDDPEGHALLSLCLSNREQYREAIQEAQTAVGLDPDDPYSHYVLAVAQHDSNRFDEARASVEEALRLNPTNPNLFSLLASVHLHQQRWNEALEAARQGLALDPEHIACANNAAFALRQLGREAEAAELLRDTLEWDPNNVYTFTNQGWLALGRGDVKAALEHFREALRLDPDHDPARAGLVEALKAQNIIYGLMLRYFLWASRYGGGLQWGLMLAGYFGQRILNSIGSSEPALRPLTSALVYLWLAFVLLTWLADPIFNLLLRLNRYGRWALSDEQRTASTWVGSTLGLAILCGLAGWATGNGALLSTAVVSAVLAVPLAGVFHCERGWPRTVMTVITVALALVGGLGVFLHLSPRTATSGTSLVTIMVFGAMISTWAGAFLTRVRPTR
jgi:tetratricopeptide (TPR) repeat protein